MLGRLLSTAASSLNPASFNPRNNGTPLESVTEEEHTSGLLFPDASLLRRSNTHAYPLQTTFHSPNASTAGAYDDRGGMELDAIKDFRVVIAQNALGDRDACILLDTRASDPSPTGLGIDSQGLDQAGTRHTRTVSSLSRGSRRNYLTQSSVVESSPLSSAADARRPTPAGSGAFSRARGRSSTLHKPEHNMTTVHRGIQPTPMILVSSIAFSVVAHLAIADPPQKCTSSLLMMTHQQGRVCRLQRAVHLPGPTQLEARQTLDQLKDRTSHLPELPFS